MFRVPKARGLFSEVPDDAGCRLLGRKDGEARRFWNPGQFQCNYRSLIYRNRRQEAGSFSFFSLQDMETFIFSLYHKLVLLNNIG